ncbi:Mitogen-activated protein kinase kinase kinase YODA [Hibiscus syriacus]|uniref:mitogen-activated protein kinase kinase kinase n=1 Tax=Hibiscus syriacus TaxID=106335 RepID=A0A6A2ZB41_HIBSY|nr:mitogen-activated protein kinase kinase kinase 3-like [Hibiscus syriacus]XP_039016940.1 mitogen-activated protein kinase kinase kinase 3-like [Hibiscus syriacus]KAE8689194.1 Mitogen-activated protein kinase kinase kinase YODA [Hibiscus syriacus]
MPAWWVKKSSKNKEESQNRSTQGTSIGVIKLSPNKTDVVSAAGVSPGGGSSGKLKAAAAADDKSHNNNNYSKSFDSGGGFVLTSGNSPRASKDFSVVVGSSGFSGFDSDSGEKIGIPLPTPSVSSMQSDHVVGLGSGSPSVSSDSSCDDSHIANDPGQFIAYRSYIDPRGQGEINARSRSPGPRAKGPTSPTSPLHHQLSAVSIDSTTGRKEDGKSVGHKLPLPPGSPTSPSASLPSISTRACGVSENSHCTLSKWRKGRLLGKGTFGHVYLGFNSESGQMCAIKEVRLVSDDRTSKESLKKLNQEINLLSQLSHPNIVRYYGSEPGEEALSVYLEYVSGGSIHKLLQEYGAFKEPVIQNYTKQILSGLAYLHGRNTVHRDIKGANILVDPNGEIKLADFGMAKHITACGAMLSFKGSPYWMAPEVVMNTNGYNLAVDIWSLGCTILEMATSKPPWNQYEGVAAIFKIGNSKDMPEIPDHLSSEAKSFIRLCLQREPSTRPTALQLLDHPFIHDQATTRVANISITKDSFPYTFDGSRTPPMSEMLSNRSNIDGDYETRGMTTTSKALRSLRDNARAITSLPVSPCSSPLRHGKAHKSAFLSPPHPAYQFVGQSSYNLADFSVNASRPNQKYTMDPWFQGTPPRTRPI